MSLRRNSSTSSERDTRRKEHKCGTCEKLCKLESEKVLLCQSCDRFFHSACQKVDDMKYQVLKADAANANPTMFWFCNSSCNLFAARFMSSMTDIKKAITNLKDDVENVKTHVCKLDSKVTSIDQGILSAEHTDQIRRVAREEIETEMSEKLNDTEKAQFVEDKFEEAVSVAVREMSERQVRKKASLFMIFQYVKLKKSKLELTLTKRNWIQSLRRV